MFPHAKAHYVAAYVSEGHFNILAQHFKVMIQVTNVGGTAN